MTNEKRREALKIESDRELEEGVFEIGARYFVRTPSFFYMGTLTAVTGSVFVFTNTSTVYDTGPYPAMFASGKGQDEQPHTGAGEMILDRGGTVLQRLLK
jgi:hypothetical protein